MGSIFSKKKTNKISKTDKIIDVLRNNNDLQEKRINLLRSKIDKKIEEIKILMKDGKKDKGMLK